MSASAGTVVGSELDFNTTYLRTILGFIGVRHVEVIAADQLQTQGQEAIDRALRAIDDAVSRR